MRRGPLIAILVVALIAVGMLVALPTAAAQTVDEREPIDESPDPDPEIDETDRQPVDEDEESEGVGGASEPGEIYADVDSDVRILSWSYDEEAQSFEIVVENDGDSRENMQIMEIIDLDADREGPLGMRQLTLRGGEESTVTVDAILDGGSAGVIVMTEESLEAGQVQPIIYEADGLGLFDGESTWGLVQLAGVSGAGGTLLTAIGIAWQKRVSRRDVAEALL